jgi:hypothetical protein
MQVQAQAPTTSYAHVRLRTPHCLQQNVGQIKRRHRNSSALAVWAGTVVGARESSEGFLDKRSQQGGVHAAPWFVQDEGDLVLVAGATGGVGQLVAAKLLEVWSCTRASDAEAPVCGTREEKTNAFWRHFS